MRSHYCGVHNLHLQCNCRCPDYCYVNVYIPHVFSPLHSTGLW